MKPPSGTTSSFPARLQAKRTAQPAETTNVPPKPIRVLHLSQALIAAFLFATNGDRAAQAIDHGGANTREVSRQIYSVAGQASYNSTFTGYYSYDFTLTVSNDWWAMEFTRNPFDGSRFIQNCDSSNLVTITYLEKISNTRVWNNGVVTVDNRKTPVPEPSVAHVVFVGFAGQFYLPPGTNGLLSPLWHTDREVNRVAFVASDWQLLAPGRPQIIRCRAEAQKWSEMLHKPQRYQTALGAIYSAITWTNFAGEAFPGAYGFTGFAPDREDGKDQALPIYKIEVTNVVFRSAVAQQLFERKFNGVAVGL